MATQAALWPVQGQEAMPDLSVLLWIVALCRRHRRNQPQGCMCIVACLDKVSLQYFDASSPASIR